jgi:beta-N-acetylhexosaminidase
VTAPGATILGCAGTGLDAEEAAFFRDADPWGFILFSRNIADAGQVRRLCGALREAVGRDAPVFIDQEGGRVARLRPPLARDWLPPLDMAARAGAGAERAFWLRYRIIAAELRALGIDGNCAPMVDVAGDTTHDFLRNRCYGTDPGVVARRGRAVADALLAGGVLPVLKHIPGHGRATADSHEDLPVVKATLAELAAQDFAPFAALADLPLGMTAHILFPALDPHLPATLSPVVMAHVRQGIGFGGLVMTDDISMGALSGSLGDLSARSLAAGCDIVLHCNGRRHEMAEVVAASGRLAAEGAARADAALAARTPPQPVDIDALSAELDGAMAGGSDG